MFNLRTKNLSDNKQQLIQGFDLLKTKNSTSEYLADDNIYDFFEYCSQFTQHNFGGPDVLEICEFFIENDFHVNLFKTTEYLGSICERIEKDSNEFQYFFYVMQLINFSTLYCRNFRIKLLNIGILKEFIKFVSNEIFLDNFETVRQYRFLLLNFGILTIEVESFKTLWNESNAVEIFLNILKKRSSFKRDICGIILNVADDK